MKLGLFDHMQKHDNPARSYVDLYKNHLEVLECADQAGMDFYFVAEHHFDMGFSECPSPGSFLGAASQRTKNIRLGPLVYVLPLWNPIRVAEEVALLDNLTQGRLEVGFGAGICKELFDGQTIGAHNQGAEAAVGSFDDGLQGFFEHPKWHRLWVCVLYRGTDQSQTKVCATKC